MHGACPRSSAIEPLFSTFWVRSKTSHRPREVISDWDLHRQRQESRKRKNCKAVNEGHQPRNVIWIGGLRRLRQEQPHPRAAAGTAREATWLAQS